MRFLSQTRLWGHGQSSRSITALAVIALLAAIVGIGVFASSAAAQSDGAQNNEVRSTVLEGELPFPGTRHFLGVEPLQRDGTIVLTLSYDPYSDPNLRGLINFLVLDEDGLRVFLAGGDLDAEEIASGSFVEFDPTGNKMRAAFRDSGRGNYTAVVYNNSTTPITYTLSAIGATLIDDDDQTTLPGSIAADANMAQAQGGVANPVPSEAPAAVDPLEAAIAAVGYQPISARRVTGSLDQWINRHYLGVDPNQRDGLVRLKMTYEPNDIQELAGNTNFWVLDEDGLRRLISGDDPRMLNLATGFPSPVGEERNTLLAAFNASGDNDYTVVVFNTSGIESTYVIEANGALLEDGIGQTNESKAAALEKAALDGVLPDLQPTATPTPVDVVTSPTLTGQLSDPFEHHYYGLLPEFVDGTMVVTMDYDPRNSQELAENINFMVLDDDGWRRVLAGARPEDVEIATGSVVQYGDDQGKLQAVLNASGKNQYTIIVYNNSYERGLYSLTAQGAMLQDASEQADSLGLP